MLQKDLDNSKAKGLLDRSFVIRCIAGRPQYNIKEVFDKTNEETHVKLKNELEKTRKLLLVYRMLHYNDTIKDVDLNIYNREAELTKPLIRLFQNSPQVLEELLPALSKCLNSKREIKSNSLEAIIYTAIRNLIPYEGHIIDHESIINEVKRISNGEDIPNQQAFYTDEIGKVSNRKIIGTLIDKFKARRTSKGTGDNKMRALEFLEEDLKKKDREFNVPDAIEIMESANVDQGFNKSDSFDSIFVSNSGTEGTQLESADVSGKIETFDNIMVKSDGIVTSRSSSSTSTSILESSQSSQTEVNSLQLIDYHIKKIAKKSIHRIYPHSDTWSCEFCKVRDDKWGMEKHTCAGILKAAAVSSSELNHSSQISK